MWLFFGLSGSRLLRGIGEYGGGANLPALFAVAIFLTLVGFAFKVSAVPFHFWAPDSYEGAPTPVTAFLSVASKTGGVVALLTPVYVGFFGRGGARQPLPWGLGAGGLTRGEPTPPEQKN